jgi:hypothetical protein
VKRLNAAERATHRPPCTGRDGYRRNRAKEPIIGSTA